MAHRSIGNAARRRFALLIATATLVAGCALPNLKPFADATAQIHASVLQTTLDVPALLDGAGKPAQATELRRLLEVRVKAMDAVLGYTESLAQITQAGQGGQHAANQVADALNGLLGALRVAPFSGEAVAVVTMAYGAVAQVRATDAFADAVERADPAIQSIAAILQKDLKALDDLLVQMKPVLMRSVIDRDPDSIAVEDYRQALEKRRRALEKQLAGAPSDAALISQSRDVTLLIEQTRDRYEPLLAQQREVGGRVQAQIARARATRQAVAEWASVHAGLARSVKAGLPPNTAVLASIAVQLQALAAKEAP